MKGFETRGIPVAIRRSREFHTWWSMARRCYCKKQRYYHRYGGRGIKVCERWRDFWKFLEDMGPKPPGLSIDRIDNDGDYEPSNCRWATGAEQARNRAASRTISFGGETLTISEWAYRLGTTLEVLRWRLKAKWPLEQALTRPVTRSNRAVHFGWRSGRPI